VGHYFRFAVSRIVGQLPDGCSQVLKQPVRRCFVYVMELPELLQNRVWPLEGRVFHWFVTGNTGEGKTSELLGYFDSTCSGIDTTSSIQIGMTAIVRTVKSQVVSNPHQCASQAPVCLADDGTTLICLIALMS
jgi:hypothetical protein